MLKCGLRGPAAGASAATYRNDDWGTAGPLPEFLIATRAAGASALEAGSKDAAVLANLDAAAPRNHSVRITSAAPAAAGNVLVEIYDLDP